MLFNDFEKVQLNEWKDKIITDLKGKDFDSTLVSATDEEINIQPIYNQESLAGNKSQFYDLSKKDLSSEIREVIEITSINEANQKALNGLKGGANSIQFNGTISSIEDLNSLLKDIMLDIINIHFYTCNPLATLNLLKQYCDSNSINFGSLNGSVSFDYLSEKDATVNYAELAEIVKNSGSLKCIAINGYNYTNAGANAIQELAFTLNQTVEYIDGLSENGISADEIISKLSFNQGIGPNYFIEIAKVRALKILWNLICEQYNSNSELYIHSNTNNYNLAAEDAQTNILRTTTEAMSALIAGSDSLSITPFNYAYEATTNFTKRIARNISILLKEEAYLDKVNDAAKGSYYIEHLTDELVTNALDLFKEVESKGGFTQNIDFIQSLIKETNDKKVAAYKNGKRTLLGVNKYPNGMENTPSYKHVESNSIFEPINLAANLK